MSATVKHIPSTSGSNLDAYLGREKEGSNLPRVLYESGQHCRPETAAQEFQALRERHGHQGAVRKVAAKYKEPEEPAAATHIKVGKNWREAKPGEIATAVRITPAVPYVKRDEAHHFIYSFDLATVNPNDPEQTQQAFEAVVAFRAEYTPGTQSKFVAHGDALGSKVAIERGEGGKFHVHEAMNAAVHSDMIVEGRHYRAGRRVAGAITHVDTYRAAWDNFLETRGHEFSLSPQDRTVLPAVGSPEYRAVRHTEQDFWARERGDISDHDRARRGMEMAYTRLAEDPSQLIGLTDAERVERMAAEVAATGDVELNLRRTQTGEVKIRSFSVPGRKQSIGSTKLGHRYANATPSVGGSNEQLDRIAHGTWEPFERGNVGSAKDIERLTQPELDRLQRAVDTMTGKERQLRSAEFEHRLRQSSVTNPKVTEEFATGQHCEQAMDDLVTHDLDAEGTRYPGQRSDDTAPEISPPSRDRGAGVQPEQEFRSDPVPPKSTPGKTTVPRSERRARVLSTEERRSAELIAVVRRERTDGGAYVDFQLAAPGPGERLRPGLHLVADKKVRRQKDGTEREVTQTWTQLTAVQYDRLRMAAGDNHVEAEGKTVYGLAADIGLPRSSGHVPNPNTFQSSRRKTIDDEVLAGQRASENRGREAERADRERRKKEPSTFELVSQAHEARTLERSRGR